MPQDLHAGDRLLSAWLRLSSTLWNTRLVSSLTYNEAHVLGLLLRGRDTRSPYTATDLIRRTHLLKSQMNKLLTTLEAKGFVARTRSEQDRRMIFISLTEEGEKAYRAEHVRIEALVGKLIERIGEDKAYTLAQDIETIITEFDDILSEE